MAGTEQRRSSISHRVHRWLRRHRRPLAAVLAGLGSVTAIIALRGAPVSGAPAMGSGPAPMAAPADGTLVPVTLSVPGVAAVLRSGDIVDVIAVDESGTGRVVSAGARVVARAAGSTLIGSSPNAVLLLAVAPPDAVELATIATTTALTAVIRDAAAGG